MRLPCLPCQSGKKRRINRWIVKTDAWLDKIEKEDIDVVKFKDSDFYYKIRATLSRRTIDSIKDMATVEDEVIVKSFITKDVEKFRDKWIERKERLGKEVPWD